MKDRPKAIPREELTRVGIDIDDPTIKIMDEIAAKERWSRRKVAYVALENYLKLRGYKNNGEPRP
jgi:predicted transcriptional regulator